MPQTNIRELVRIREQDVPTAIERVKKGAFAAEDYGQYSYMKYGGASLAPYGTWAGKIDDKVKSLVAEREAEIRDGLFRVNVNDSEPKSTK